MDIAAGFCALYRPDGVRKVYDIFTNTRVNLVPTEKKNGKFNLASERACIYDIIYNIYYVHCAGYKQNI